MTEDPQDNEAPIIFKKKKHRDTTEERLAVANQPLPFSDEAEKGILSCLIQSPSERLSESRLTLQVDAFYHTANRLVYEALLAMLDEGAPIDVAALTHYLRERELLDKIGGPASIMELFNFIPAVAHFPHYLRILQQKHKLRRLIGLCADILYEANDTHANAELDPIDLIASAQERIIALTSSEDTTGYHSWEDVMDVTLGDIEEALSNMGHIPANRLATGFTDLDRRTGGLEGNCYFVLGARPSVGKTSFAFNIIENIALGSGHYKEFNQPPLPAAFFSLEMSAKSIGRRSIVGGAGLNLNQMRFGLRSRDDQDKLNTRIHQMRGAKIHFYDVPSMSIERIRATARILKKRHGIRLIVIDYLQLITSTYAERRKFNRHDEVGYISKQIKAMTKELEIPVIALAQLNRNVEDRTSARPKSSDLRECGGIEQDADIIALLQRLDNAPEDPDAHQRPDALCIIAKGRDVGVEDIALNFCAPITKFSSRTDRLLSNNSEQREQPIITPRPWKPGPRKQPKQTPRQPQQGEFLAAPKED